MHVIRQMVPSSDHLASLLRLALPVAAVQVGFIFMGAVDTVMVGHVSARDLAAVALGNLYFFLTTSFGLGTLLALDPLVSQAFGAADRVGIARAIQRGFVIALGLAVFSSLLLTPGRPLLTFFRQPADVIPVAADYALVSIPGVLPFYLFVVLRQSLQSMGRVRPIVVVILLANLANVFFNWVLIFGNLGAPALGAVGSGWATTLSRMVHAPCLIGHRLAAYSILCAAAPDRCARYRAAQTDVPARVPNRDPVFSRVRGLRRDRDSNGNAWDHTHGEPSGRDQPGEHNLHDGGWCNPSDNGSRGAGRWFRGSRPGEAFGWGGVGDRRYRDGVHRGRVLDHPGALGARSTRRTWKCLGSPLHSFPSLESSRSSTDSRPWGRAFSEESEIRSRRWSSNLVGFWMIGLPVSLYLAFPGGARTAGALVGDGGGAGRGGALPAHACAHPFRERSDAHTALGVRSAGGACAFPFPSPP